MVGGAGIVVEVLTRDKTRQEKTKTPANRQLVLLNKHSNLGSCYYMNVQGSSLRRLLDPFPPRTISTMMMDEWGKSTTSVASVGAIHLHLHTNEEEVDLLLLWLLLAGSCLVNASSIAPRWAPLYVCGLRRVVVGLIAIFIFIGAGTETCNQTRSPWLQFDVIRCSLACQRVKVSVSQAGRVFV